MRSAEQAGLPSTVSTVPDPLLVRAWSDAPSVPVLKIAHGAPLRSVPKPTCWNGSFANVATNSRERPAEYVAVVPSSVPSTASVTATDRGRPARTPRCARPTRRERRPGERRIDRRRELDLTVTRVAPPPRTAKFVPAEKSAVVVSVATNAGTANVAGASASGGEVAAFPARSVDVTR